MLPKINPMAKLVANLVALTACVIVFDPYTPLMMLGAALLFGSLGGGLRARQWLQVLPFSLFAFGMFWMTAAWAVVPGAEPVFRLGPFVLTDLGISLGLSLAFRVLAIGAFSVLFLANTDTTDLVLSLAQQGRLAPRYAYSLLAALRFLPTLETELQTIRAAHRIRGAGGSGRDLVRRWYRYAIPLLAGGIRRAERVALAMEARGFHSRRDRTYFRTLRWRVRDTLFVLATGTIISAIFWSSARMGWLVLFGRWMGF